MRCLELAGLEGRLDGRTNLWLRLAAGAQRRDQEILREKRLHTLGVHALGLDGAGDAVIDQADEAVLRLARLDVPGLVVDEDAGLGAQRRRRGLEGERDLLVTLTRLGRVGVRDGERGAGGG